MNRPIERKHLVVLYISMILTIVASIVFAIYTADASLHHEIAVRESAAADSMRPVCTYLKAQLDVYNESPARTPTGIKLQQATEDVYVKLGCSLLPPK